MSALGGAPAFRPGVVLATASALAFGATTPLVQHFGRGAGPFETAAFLYAGAAVVSMVPWARRSDKESPLRASDGPRLLLVALLGALAAPVALAWGLQHTDGVAASLLLNLEAVFTVLLARALWGEPIGARAAAALATILAAGALLVTRGAMVRVHPDLGALAVAGAAFGWAADSTLGRPLADRNPTHVVFSKCAAGAALSLGLAALAHEPLVAAKASAALGACGAVGYGLSLQLYLLAQRRIGAARTGSVFAIAPFVGAAVAWGMGQRVDGFAIAAGALCAVGVWLHLTERHEHLHAHDRIDHDHAHRHDDGHHAHAHDPPVSGEHAHPHSHEEIVHVHPHGLDPHHRHRH
jgi:drug/metabolite transporter (DMT)-like permease